MFKALQVQAEYRGKFAYGELLGGEPLLLTAGADPSFLAVRQLLRADEGGETGGQGEGAGRGREGGGCGA